jgi:hypothetical protein
MMRPSNPCLPRRLLLALATVLLAATSTASAQSCGTGGCAFWATEVNDSWFNPFRWGGILPWQGGVPDQSVTCRIELAVQVDVLGQGQAASCHHLQFNHVGAVVRVAGSSFRSELNVHGTQMDNNGLILIGGQDALQDSSLIIHNNTNANGANGRIRLSAPPNHGAFLSPISNLGWVLVNWPSHTIEGNGTIRVRLQNDGLVDANVPGRSLTFEGGHSVDNNSLVRARDGGSIVLSMPNGAFGFHQFGLGRIVIEDGSGLALIGAGDQGLRGGRLQTIGSGVATVFTQGFPIEDVHLQGGSRLTFSGNAGLFIGPLGLQNDGLIHTGPSGFVTSRFGESTIMTGSGRLQLEGGALSALFGGGGQAMVNSPGHTIGGFGTIALALTNRGELLADRNGLSSGPGQLTLQTSAQINEGTMVARNGGTLSLQGITLTQDSLALVRAEQDSAIVLEGAAAVVGGRLATSGNGVIVPNTSDARLENLTLNSGTHLTVPCSRTLTLVGTINNSGTITLDNAGCGPNFAVLRGNGATALAQSGEVRLRSDGPSGNVTLEGSGGLLTLSSGQVLTGTGRISGSVRVDGAIAPDQPYAPTGPIGTLTVASGSVLTLGSSNDTVLEFAGPSSFDRIAGTGTIQLGGRLIIGAVGGYVPPLGTSFDLITGSAISGRFRSVVFPPEYAGLDARIEVLADRVRLTIVAPLMVDGFEAP